MVMRTDAGSSNRRGLAGTVLAIAAGLLFWSLRGLDGLSYDALFWLKKPAKPEEAVIVSMDEKSFDTLGQKPDNWDRSLHATLLDRMTQDQARLVVFDILFTDPGTPPANEALARAIKKNGRVILAASLALKDGPGISVTGADLPKRMFLDAGARWGISEVRGHRDSLVRQYCASGDSRPSLPWAVADYFDKPLTKRFGIEPDWWLNYYGPAGTLANVSFCEVTNQPAGYFSNKLVFVGGALRTRYARDVADVFRTPYTRLDGPLFFGVEVTATAVLNLLREDYLTRMPAWLESIWLFAWAFVFGWGLSLLRPAPAACAALLGFLGVTLLALLLFQSRCVWFPWLITAAVQIPGALAWSLAPSLQQRTAHPAEDARPAHPEAAAAAKTIVMSPEALRQPSPGIVLHQVPEIPDHTILRSVGKGAYGEVWLARNAIGTFHAVKIVYRDSFESADPYEREFRGIQKFMPLSLHHPKLVHLLHVGRNERDGYLFYIMEAGDDENNGSTIDPVTYSPRNLSKELKKRGRLPVQECVELGLDLSAALDYLHQNQLIHRDIKPANIIYVRGVPKMADIGLVTEVAHQGRGVTYVGTEGYMPPEGPGTAGADVYSLGKVLYEACSGLPVSRYPEMSETVLNDGAEAGFTELNQIVLNACESDPSQRYSSAGLLREDLLKLQERLWPGSPH
jgi:CHASE2 domain-containing sensor protein